MLLANYSILNSSPGRAIGGFTNAFNAYKPSTMYTRNLTDLNDAPTLTQMQSFPTGTEGASAYLLAFKGGELSSTTSIVGRGALSGSLMMARTMSSSMTGAGDLSASMGLLSQLAANLAGVGSLSASMSLAIALAADMAGTGTLSPNMGLLVGMLSSMSGVGTLSANLTGIAKLEASIYVNSGTATIKELSDGVWEALATEHNNTGTMGQKLNGAGSAGDPWSTDLSGNTYTGNQAGKKLKDAADNAELSAIK